MSLAKRKKLMRKKLSQKDIFVEEIKEKEEEIEIIPFKIEEESVIIKIEAPKEVEIVKEEELIEKKEEITPKKFKGRPKRAK